jgi:hypothetical protein
VISHEWGKDQAVFATSGTYPSSFVTQIFHNGQISHGDIGSTKEYVLSLNNSRLGDFVHRIYPIELEIKDITDTDRTTSSLNLHLEIEGRLSQPKPG